MTTIGLNRCVFGDALRELRKVPDETFHCVLTSPAYWGLRDYQARGQYGLEATPALYVRRLVRLFREVRRVLREDGTVWLNLGDSYAGKPGGYQGKNGARASRTFTARISLPKGGDGLKPKDLVGIPWRTALALQADGWWLRSEIIWAKPNPMPESVADRPTKSHEQVFLLSKASNHYFNGPAIAEPCSEPNWTRDYNKAGLKANAANAKLQETLPKGRVISGGDTRRARDVWTIAGEPYGGAHFATMPTELARRCILAGCPEGGVVLDPFFGSGTTGQVAEALGRLWFGIELNREYAPLIAQRTKQTALLFAEPPAPAPAAMLDQQCGLFAAEVGS